MFYEEFIVKWLYVYATQCKSVECLDTLKIVREDRLYAKEIFRNVAGMRGHNYSIQGKYVIFAVFDVYLVEDSEGV